MVNAGRILIIAQGEWSNLVNYEQLDLVSYGNVAYLARQASVGQNPSLDVSMTYWQPFGTVSDVATTSRPGLVMPDGTTITIDDTGLIKAALRVSDLSNVVLTSLADGQILRYNGTTSKWVNVSIGAAAYKGTTNAVTQNSTDLIESGAVYTGLDAKQPKNLATARTIGGTSRTTVEAALGALADSAYLENGLTSTSTTKALTAAQGKALNDALANKVNTSAIANNLSTTASGKVLDARQGKTLNDSKANTNLLGQKWTSSTSYIVGQYCISGDVLYKCILANTNHQPPNSTYWKATDVNSELAEIASSSTAQTATVIDDFANNNTEHSVTVTLSQYHHIGCAVKGVSTNALEGVIDIPISVFKQFGTIISVGQTSNSQSLLLRVVYVSDTQIKVKGTNLDSYWGGKVFVY